MSGLDEQSIPICSTCEEENTSNRWWVLGIVNTEGGGNKNIAYLDIKKEDQPCKFNQSGGKTHFVWQYTEKNGYDKEKYILEGYDLSIRCNRKHTPDVVLTNKIIAFAKREIENGDVRWE
jgi:hypothetical protein